MLDLSDTRMLDPRLVSLLKPNSVDAARYERLRLAVENIPRNGAGVVVAITSPCDGEGKTLTAINLAGSLAQNVRRNVLLIELDLRGTKGLMRDYLGSRKWCPPGVVDAVVGEVRNWQSLAHDIPAFNLHLMPSGKRTNSPYEILNAPQLGDLLEAARQRYDYVILDTCAATFYPDTQLIAKWVDQFVILVSSGLTSKKQLADCLNLMPPEKVLGLVFNRSDESGGTRHGIQ
jgi:protein-tyrosine kinase